MNRKSIDIALALSAICLKAQQPTAPQIGVVHGTDGSLRAISGLPANVMYGALLGRGVNAASFSSTAGLVSKMGQIQYLGVSGSVLGSYATKEPSPLFAVGSVNTGNQASSIGALAWLPSSRLLVVWSALGTATQVQVAPLPGSVIALSFASAGFADLLVVLGDGGVERCAVSLATGQVAETSVVSGASGVAYEQNGFLLLPGADGMLVEFPDGRQQRLGIKNGSVGFEAISEQWVHLFTTAVSPIRSHWLLHLDSAAKGEAPLHLSELPAPPERVPKTMPRLVGNALVRVTP